MKVTKSFIRNLRKGYLNPDGSPKEGKTVHANVLQHSLQFLKDGNYTDAVEFAKEFGFDLEALYKSYTDEVTKPCTVRSHKYFLIRAYDWAQAHGVNILWADLYREVYLRA